MCVASICLRVYVSTLLCFLTMQELQKLQVFLSPLQWLLGPTKETGLHMGRVHISTTVKNLQNKSDPNQTGRAFKETKTIRDKHPNQPHMKVSARPERGAEMQREFMGIRNELCAGQPCSRVNFTEGANAKVTYTHTGAGQIPISSLHMLSTNVNLELMKRSWF